MKLAIGILLAVLLMGCSSHRYFLFHSTTPYTYEGQSQVVPEAIVVEQEFEPAREHGPHTEVTTQFVPHSGNALSMKSDVERKIARLPSFDTLKREVKSGFWKQRDNSAKVGIASASASYLIAILGIATITTLNPWAFLLGALYLTGCISAVVIGGVSMKKHRNWRYAVTALAMGIAGLVAVLGALFFFYPPGAR